MEWLPMIAGGLTGLVLGVFWRESGLDRFLSILFRRGRARLLSRSAATSGTHLRLGYLSVSDWEILDGVSPDGVVVATKVVSEELVRLPDDLLELRRDVEAETLRRNERNEAAPYNGPRYAISQIGFHRSSDRLETNTCHLNLKHSDYFNFLATGGSLDHTLPDGTTVRRKYYAGIDPRNITRDFLFHSFGVNLAVITSDERLIVVQRSESVDILPDVLNSSVDEGLSRDLDVAPDRSVSVKNVGRRGLREELGLDADTIQEYRLTSVGYSRHWCQYGALGHVILEIPWRDVAKALCFSKDASFEIGRADDVGEGTVKAAKYSVFAVPNSPGEFARFLREHGKPMTSWALTCFLTSFLATGWTARQVETAFSSRRWRGIGRRIILPSSQP